MMGRVSINREQTTETNTTAVSNVFIDKYMSEANDAQLKIYLYLLRMMRAGRPTSLSDLADRFNLTEKDITRALRFWEKRGIISMEYDSDRKLSGIHLEDLKEPAGVPEEPAPAAEQEEPAAAAPAAAPTAAVDPSQLLFIAEQYLGRPLSVTDTQTLFYIRDELAFSDALLDYLLAYCAERGKTDFRYIQKVALGWRDKGYETPEQAKSGSYRYDKRIYEIMDLLGLKNVPTDTEAEFVLRWIRDYRLPIDIIREACRRTVLATQKRRLEYCDRILASWHESGVTKKSDIADLDAAHEASRKTAQKAPAAGQTAARPNAKVHNFPQREHDFPQLEKQLIKNGDPD